MKKSRSFGRVFFVQKRVLAYELCKFLVFLAYELEKNLLVLAYELGKYVSLQSEKQIDIQCLIG